MVKRRKIAVVTGGAGFLGSHLCDRFILDGLKVICVDNLITGSQENVKHLLKNKDSEGNLLGACESYWPAWCL